MYDYLGFSSASVIIYELSESSRFARMANLGFSLGILIIYNFLDSTLLEWQPVVGLVYPSSKVTATRVK